MARGLILDMRNERVAPRTFKELLLADTPRATLTLPSRRKYRRRQPEPLD
jgi:hypothetical protein